MLSKRVAKKEGKPKQKSRKRIRSGGDKSSAGHFVGDVKPHQIPLPLDSDSDRYSTEKIMIQTTTQKDQLKVLKMI